ncbi:MAG TPA: hypothetical protein VMH05_10880 [Bryobacteraceae bacterium]|nr:hypothetical protein [Bryobacteraceae bacterium]
MTRLRLAPVLFLLTIPAWADVIYSSGAISGTNHYDAFDTPPWSLSQPFTVGSSSYVTDLSNVGIWIFGGYSLQSLTWTISTASDGGGTIEATDTVASPASSTQLTPASNYGNSGQADVYNMSFSVPDVLLAPGTYYLTLSNGFTNCDCPDNADTALYWDENDVKTTGVAYFEGNTDITNVGWSFQVDGTSSISAVPEPSYILLLGVGLAALVVQRTIRSRSRAVDSPLQREHRVSSRC